MQPAPRRLPASQPARRRSEDRVRRRAGVATVAVRRSPRSGAVPATRGRCWLPLRLHKRWELAAEHAGTWLHTPPCHVTTAQQRNTHPPRRSRRPCAARGAACHARFALPARSFRSSTRLKRQCCRARRRCIGRIDRAGRRRFALSSRISSVCYCCNPSATMLRHDTLRVVGRAMRRAMLRSGRRQRRRKTSAGACRPRPQLLTP